MVVHYIARWAHTSLSMIYTCNKYMRTSPSFISHGDNTKSRGRCRCELCAYFQGCTWDLIKNAYSDLDLQNYSCTVTSILKVHNVIEFQIKVDSNFPQASGMTSLKLVILEVHYRERPHYGVSGPGLGLGNLGLILDLIARDIEVFPGKGFPDHEFPLRHS